MGRTEGEEERMRVRRRGADRKEAEGRRAQREKRVKKEIKKGGKERSIED